MKTQFHTASQSFVKIQQWNLKIIVTKVTKTSCPQWNIGLQIQIFFAMECLRSLNFFHMGM